MKKKKINPIVREYKLCFDYIKASKNYIYGIIFLFFLFSLFGFFVPMPDEVNKQLLDYFKQLIRQTEGFNAKEMILYLFQNNVLASFAGLIFGFFFGIFSVFNAIANGFVLGFAAKLSVLENGVFSLWRLFPHGIFELPALFISLGLGVKFGTFILQKNKIKSFKEYFLNSMKIFFLIIVPLLIIAAIIEGALIVFGN